MRVQMGVRGFAFSVIVASSFVLLPSHGRAQDAATFYSSGHELTMLATSAPGGGYDWYARTVSRYMSGYLPGHPTFIVRNMVGAGGIIAANYLYNVAPKDGSVMAILDRSVLTAPLLYGAASKAKYDAAKFNLLGSASKEMGMGIVSMKAPATTIEDMRKVQVTLGAQGTETDDGLYGRLFNKLYGTKFKIIPGYPGQKAIMMGVERGELDGQFFSGWSGINTNYAIAKRAKGEWRFFVQMTTHKLSAYPDTPGVLDLITKPEDRQLVEMLLSRLDLGRPFVAPPNIPADRLAMLRDAFHKTMDDKDYIADAKKQTFPISPIYGVEAQEIVAKIYRTPKNIVQRARTLVAGE